MSAPAAYIAVPVQQQLAAAVPDVLAALTNYATNESYAAAQRGDTQRKRACDAIIGALKAFNASEQQRGTQPPPATL